MAVARLMGVEAASIPSHPHSLSHSRRSDSSGVQLPLLVLPVLAVVLVISAAVVLMFWRRRKTVAQRHEHEHHELQSSSRIPPQSSTPPPTRLAIKTRNRSQSAPPPSAALRASMSSSSKAKFSTESIIAIDLRASPPQSPAFESCTPYPTRPWDGSGDFPDTGGLVKDLQPFAS
ncbi:hypothetical protein AURDEDRAFT_167010 [Auricularia subglabra TFB-10046 SS5]|nr:hypothetical protein AURDEDRAFT_167010 [Auricularia subglabra TFB-10046 SS5]